MRPLLLLSILLFVASTLTGDTVNTRNLAWNNVVATYKELDAHLKPVQEYLQAHEYEPKLKVIDAQAFVELDKAVKKSKELTKKLERLQDEMK